MSRPLRIEYPGAWGGGGDKENNKQRLIGDLTPSSGSPQVLEGSPSLLAVAVSSQEEV